MLAIFLFFAFLILVAYGFYSSLDYLFDYRDRRDEKKTSNLLESNPSKDEPSMLGLAQQVEADLYTDTNTVPPYDPSKEKSYYSEFEKHKASLDVYKFVPVSVSYPAARSLDSNPTKYPLGSYHYSIEPYIDEDEKPKKEKKTKAKKPKLKKKTKKPKKKK